MQCPSCNGFRPASNAPCPLCNAPSPLINEAWNGQYTSFPGNQNQAALPPAWGGSGVTQNNWGSSNGQMGFPAPQTNFSDSGVQQMAFPQAQQPSGQLPNGSDNSFWSHNKSERQTRKPEQDQSQALLPVPYQARPDAQGLAILPSAFPTIAPGVPQVNSLLPALPDADQEAPVYVAPMYTKPRPIIPRYRAISGLISVIVVVALLCGGSIYYAQATGKFAFFEKLFGNYTPPSISASQGILNVPSNQIVFTKSPAANVVYSVGISNRENNGQITMLVNKFTVGQAIYLDCGAKTDKQKAPGSITIKWYTDNHFYRSDSSKDPILPNQSVAVTFTTIYGLPAEGKAEVYWNDQLAATVLFVVEPSAA
ncbi:MAG TPA: hypothetical protein VGD98_19500 [Ktedonobacteraceae bacterium]